MEFHPSKCNILRITRKKVKTIYQYTLHGQALEGKPDTKYLGVTISNDMAWGKHIDSISSRANSKLGFLRRNLRVRDAKLRESAYKAIVRPAVEYCATVWDPHTQQQARRLEMVQRRAARWVTGRYHNTSSVTDMLNQLGWRSLALRRVDSRLVTLFKITKGIMDIPMGNKVQFQRDGIHLKPIFARTQYYEYSFFPRTATDWNGLPRNILQVRTVATFKRRVVTVAHGLPY